MVQFLKKKHRRRIDRVRHNYLTVFPPIKSYGAWLFRSIYLWKPVSVSHRRSDRQLASNRYSEASQILSDLLGITNFSLIARQD